MASDFMTGFLGGLTSGMADQQQQSDTHQAMASVADAAKDIPATRADGEGKGNRAADGSLVTPIDNSRSNQLFHAITAYSAAYIQSDGDQGQALKAASQATQNLDNLAYRSEVARNQLLTKDSGWDRQGVMNWIKTGDNTLLVPNSVAVKMPDGTVTRMSAKDAATMAKGEKTETITTKMDDGSLLVTDKATGTVVNRIPSSGMVSVQINGQTVQMPAKDAGQYLNSATSANATATTASATATKTAAELKRTHDEDLKKNQQKEGAIGAQIQQVNDQQGAVDELPVDDLNSAVKFTFNPTSSNSSVVDAHNTLTRYGGNAAISAAHTFAVITGAPAKTDQDQLVAERPLPKIEDYAHTENGGVKYVHDLEKWQFDSTAYLLMQEKNMSKQEAEDYLVSKGINKPVNLTGSAPAATTQPAASKSTETPPATNTNAAKPTTTNTQSAPREVSWDSLQ